MTSRSPSPSRGRIVAAIALLSLAGGVLAAAPVRHRVPARAATTPASSGNTFFGVIDYDGDGHADLVLRRANGDLMLYPGDGGTGPLADTPVQIGNGWTNFTPAGLGDWDGDGHADIVVRSPGYDLMLYPGDGNRGYSSQQAAKIGNGWRAYRFVGVGDWDGDGHLDTLAVQVTTGALMLFPGDGTRGYSSQAAVMLVAHWGNYLPFGVADWDGDGHLDIIARDSSGNLMLFPGVGGATPPGAPVQIGNGWDKVIPVGIADWDGDGHPDILVRNPAHALMLYPGQGTRGYSSRPAVQLATGF